MSLIQIFSDQSPPWYAYLILFVLTPIALLITYKVFINYKVIEFGNNQIKINYTVRRKSKAYTLDSVVHWKESIVKTGKNSTFKEIEIQFDDNSRINLGLREYTSYSSVYAYLGKKLDKKKLTG